MMSFNCRDKVVGMIFFVKGIAIKKVVKLHNAISDGPLILSFLELK